MAIQKFKIEDVDNEIVQIIQQSQRINNQKPQPNLVQSLLQRAKAKRAEKAPAPDNNRELYGLMAEIKGMLSAKPEASSRRKSVRKNVERDQTGRITSVLEEEE